MVAVGNRYQVYLSDHRHRIRAVHVILHALNLEGIPHVEVDVYLLPLGRMFVGRPGGPAPGAAPAVTLHESGAVKMGIDEIPFSGFWATQRFWP